MDEISKPKAPKSNIARPVMLAVKAAVLYFLCAVLWFAVLERLARRVTTDPERQELFKGLTGLFFVIGSAVLISILIRREFIKQQRAQAIIQAGQDRLASIISSAMDGIISVDPQQRIVLLNPAASQMFGFPEDQLLGQPLSRLIPAGIRPARTEKAGGPGAPESPDARSRINKTVSGLRSDGVEFPLEVSLSGRDAGADHASTIVLRDITERREAEQKLRTQLARLDLLSRTTRAIGERQDLPSIFQVVIRSLEDHLPIDFGCACLCDAALESVTVTSVGVKSQPLALELAMTDRAQINVDQNGLSRCVHGELVYEPDIARVPFPFPQRLARGGLRSLVIAPLLVESRVFGVLVSARQRPHAFSSTDCEFLRQLSEHVALAAHQAQLHGALQRAYDELRQTQQAVMQQERLRVLGQMASGIAHDINNALSPVALYTGFLLETESSLSKQGREYLEIISRAVDDVAATVARLREFYRQREPQLTLVPLPLNRLVPEVIDLTRARWSDMPNQRGAVIQIKTELMDNLPAIMGVESEIREALTNLIFNAVDAMPAGGTLKLRTGVREDGVVVVGPTARQVFVEVTDSGIGMDENTRRRCLEPFYTTKGERGTGLGLAMVYGVVQRHGADLEIMSQPGQGTTFRLNFAIPQDVVSPTTVTSAASPTSRRLRILVIDDDPILLKSLRDILESDGHVVVAANDGREGISAFHDAREREEHFDVVITDLGMPYLDGRKVASAVKATAPSTPVILLTGWGQRIVVEGDVPPEVDQVLSKPPKLNDLRGTLTRLCAQPNS
ncbi:response regulator [bacterium]|nr:response regulator [bacterium]